MPTRDREIVDDRVRWPGLGSRPEHTDADPGSSVPSLRLADRLHHADPMPEG